MVDTDYVENVTVKLTNTVITWVENSCNEVHKVLLDKNGKHIFYVDGGAVTMNCIKRIVYSKG